MKEAGVVQDLDGLAQATHSMSARDLRSICEVTERRWASAIIKGTQDKESLPPLDVYLASARTRQQAL